MARKSGTVPLFQIQFILTAMPSMDLHPSDLWIVFMWFTFFFLVKWNITLCRTKVSEVEDLHYKITTIPTNHIKFINPTNNKIITYLSIYAYLLIMQQAVTDFENITYFFVIYTVRNVF